MGRHKARRQLVVEGDRKTESGAELLTAGLQSRTQAGLRQLQAEGGEQLAQLHPGGVQLVADLAQKLFAVIRQVGVLHLQATDLHLHTGERLGDRVMQLPGNGGALFHHNQLLLFFLMAVEGQGGGELLHQRIDQLLLIVAQMASGGQRRQQNTVLHQIVGQSPL
ncbi:hypothetical protein D3C75_426880 [compost metagenome]